MHIRRPKLTSEITPNKLRFPKKADLIVLDPKPEGPSSQETAPYKIE
jgi:hypothetical protein